MRLIFAFILCTTLSNVQATENSDSTYFVWAKSGLNVREVPGTDSDIIQTLVLGDSVTIQQETDIAYNMTGIAKVDSTQHYHTRYERKAPFILYGKWVKVVTSTGKIGYVVNQYLLSIAPYPEHDFNLKVMNIDTIQKNLYGWIGKFLEKKYGNGIISYDCINEIGYFETFIFPNFTIEEVFVIITSKMAFTEQLIVKQNWEKSLKFNDNEMCNISIIQKDGYVSLCVECSC